MYIDDDRRQNFVEINEKGIFDNDIRGFISIFCVCL